MTTTTPRPTAVQHAARCVAFALALGLSAAACAPVAPNADPPTPNRGDTPAGISAGTLGTASCGVAPNTYPSGYERTAVLASSKIGFTRASQRADIEQGRIDPRILASLITITKDHRITISALCTDHDRLTSRGSVSNHHRGRGVDINTVDGVAVRSSNTNAKRVVDQILGFTGSLKAEEVGQPWYNSGLTFTSGHSDHIHHGYDSAYNGSYHLAPVEDPKGALDLVSSPSPGMVRVGGWSFDPSNKSASNDVHVYVGTEGHNLGATTGTRSDVNAAFGITGRHGYDTTFATAATGAVNVCAYGINNFGPGQNTRIGCKTITVKSPNPIGALDLVTSPSPGVIRVGGWSFDPSSPTSSNHVHVYVGAEGHNLGATIGTRNDINGVYGITGRHGYDATFKTAARGSVQVCAYGINNYGPGQNTQIGCKNVTVR